MINKIKAIFKNPFLIFRSLGQHNLLNALPDETFLKIVYYSYFRKKLKLHPPITFNEKIQWLKLNNRKPEYTSYVDKYLVRKYVEQKIGKEYLVPLLGVWDNANKINFDELPSKFVLKCNHDCGSYIICHDKEKLNITATHKKLNRALKRNYYYFGREWAYKNVKPLIIAEQNLCSTEDSLLRDYKFLCFSGKVKCLFVCSERESRKVSVNFYDLKWNEMPFERHYKKNNSKLTPPKNLDLMIQMSEHLAENIPFVRVDFYEIDNTVYFGELTFYPGNGMEAFTPDEYDELLGSWIDLPGIMP